MNIAGYAILGDAQNIPLITQDRTQQYSASLTKTIGRAQHQDRRRRHPAAVRRDPELSAESALLTYRQPADPQRRPARAATASRRSCSAIRRRCSGRTRRSSRSYHTNEPSAVRPGRLARHVVADAQHRPALRRLHAVHRGDRTSLSNLDLSTGRVLVAGAERRVARPLASRPTTRTSRRASASRRRCRTRWCCAAATG